MPISLSAARNESVRTSDRFTPGRLPPTRCDDAPVTLNGHLRALHGYSSRRHFRRNETIFGEGDPADSVYKVISGTVRLCHCSPDGRRHIIDFVLAGDLMGFLECADQPAAAEAVSDVTLISYPRACVDRLARSNPTIRTRVLCHLSATPAGSTASTFRVEPPKPQGAPRFVPRAARRQDGSDARRAAGPAHGPSGHRRSPRACDRDRLPHVGGVQEQRRHLHAKRARTDPERHARASRPGHRELKDRAMYALLQAVRPAALMPTSFPPTSSGGPTAPLCS